MAKPGGVRADAGGDQLAHQTGFPSAGSPAVPPPRAGVRPSAIPVPGPFLPGACGGRQARPARRGARGVTSEALLFPVPDGSRLAFTSAGRPASPAGRTGGMAAAGLAPGIPGSRVVAGLHEGEPAAQQTYRAPSRNAANAPADNPPDADTLPVRALRPGLRPRPGEEPAGDADESVESGARETGPGCCRRRVGITRNTGNVQAGVGHRRLPPPPARSRQRRL